MVSIHCMTYNQEGYIEDALKGFIMQQTDFPFVAVVIDDCSTDGTARIIRKYAEKYPEIIKGVYLKENYRSQGKSKKEFLYPYDKDAKYIAKCEGDDYWIDPKKLQKQVDFLEEHDEYSLCCSASKVFDQETGEFTGIKGSELCEKYETILIGCNDINTATTLYRKEAMTACARELKSSFPRPLIFDTSYWYWFAYHGLVKYMPEPMAVYRVLEESACHTKDEDKRFELDLKFLKLKLLFISKYPLEDGRQLDVINTIEKEIRDLCRYYRWIGENRVRESKSYRIGSYIKRRKFWK